MTEVGDVRVKSKDFDVSTTAKKLVGDECTMEMTQQFDANNQFAVFGIAGGLISLQEKQNEADPIEEASNGGDTKSDSTGKNTKPHTSG